MPNKKEKKPAECPKCGYLWETKAKGSRITCPECFANRDKEAFLTDSAKVKMGLKGGKNREKAVANAIRQTILNQYPELQPIDIVSIETMVENYKEKMEEKIQEMCKSLAHEIVRECQKERMKRKKLEEDKEDEKEESARQKDSISDSDKEKMLEERRKVNLDVSNVE